MTKHVVSTDTTSQIVIGTQADDWVVKDGVLVNVSNEVAIGFNAQSSDATLTVNGWVNATSGIFNAAAIGDYGSNTQINVGQSGHVSSDFTGISLVGDDASLDNAGSVQSSGFYGIYTAGIGHVVENSGKIYGPNGIYASTGALEVFNSGTIGGEYGLYSKAGNTSVHNHSGGTISGTTTAIELNTEIGDHATVINHGKIGGTGLDSIDGFAGDERIVNFGSIEGTLSTGDGSDRLVLKAGSTIDGNVSMGDGDDTLDLRQGAFGNSLFSGGYGDDTYLVSSRSAKLGEESGAGIDTVRSTISYTLHYEFEKLVLLGKDDLGGHGNSADNWLYGNKGDNHLSGGSGSDVLFGMSGTDTLTGGTGQDYFVFGNGYGKDMITDFEDGTDIINLHYVSGVTSFADINKISQEGSNVEIHLGHGQVLTLENMSAANLSDADFLF
jgi:Ca2+-binding RTX toxin-like protein